MISELVLQRSCEDISRSRDLELGTHDWDDDDEVDLHAL